MRKPLTLKSTRKRIEERKKWQRREKKAKRQFLPRKTKQASRKKTKHSGKPSHCNLYRCRTGVFLGQHGFRKTLKKYKYIRTPFAVLVQAKNGKHINLDPISKQVKAPQLLKRFFLEIRQTAKEKKGKEYEPATLQTYRNGLRRYFLERPCPSAVDNFNFDVEKSSGIKFEKVSVMLSMKTKKLKHKGLRNKLNAA